MRDLIAVLLFTCLSFSNLLILAASGEGDDLRRFQATSPAMGVKFKIVLFAKDAATARAAFEAAFTRIEQLEQVLSDYRDDSEISKLCQSGGSGQFTKVSDDLWKAMTISCTLRRETNGAFDPTVGALARLWKDAISNKVAPDEARRKQALDSTGFKFVKFNQKERAIQILNKGLRIDLGGIGKGMAADAALEELKKVGISQALVDASGDVAMGDAPPGKTGWKVQVSSLSKEQQRILVLENCGVATSGDRYQFLEIDGKRYSHIIDPRTGMGIEGRGSYTIISPNATCADGYASALAVMKQEGVDMLEKKAGHEAYLQLQIESNIETLQTSGFAKYLASRQPKQPN